jgi:nitroreductase
LFSKTDLLSTNFQFYQRKIMTKIAPTQHPIHNILKNRWSPRTFSNRPVEHEKLLSLLEAARWAPSSANEQPWYFIIATKANPVEFERAVDCLRPNNQRWAKDAPVLMFSVARSNRHNDVPNRFAFYDVGQATAHMLAQATAFELYIRQMGGIDVDKVRETYQIPESYAVVAGIALGYLGTIEQLPEDMQAHEQAIRERKPLSDFVFTESWGQTPPWLDKA